MKKVLIAICAAAIAAPAHATIWGFAAPMIDGSQENPPHASNAYGTGSFTINDQTWAVEGSVNIWNLAPSQITGFHIHQGAVGVNGPVRFDVMANQVAGSPFNAGGFWVYVFDGTLNLGSQANNQAFLNLMIAGDSYFNVHTPTWPAGEIRGQIDCVGAVPEPATLAVVGLGIVPFLRRRRK